MGWLSWVAVVAAVAVLGVLAWLVRRSCRQALHIWLPGYLARRPARVPRAGAADPVDVIFCLADHWEPGWRDAPETEQRRRVSRWVDQYPALADDFHDADGRCPQHTWFYPFEQYRAEHLDALADLVRRGYGEVELHWHHDGLDEHQAWEALLDGKQALAGHGLLAYDPSTHTTRYGFVHGNWALCNSHRDGLHCGINAELVLLAASGCYADLTLPGPPNSTQTRKVNSIYYAANQPGRPKSHDTGVDVRVGGQASGDLMIVQGPLAFNWRSRKAGILPRIENADLSADNPPTPDRVDLWVRQGIGVAGRPEWVFVKVHTHGCVDAHGPVLLGDPVRRMHQHLARSYNDGRRYRLHYVVAREMFNLVKAAEAGHRGNPDAYRDFILLPRWRVPDPAPADRPPFPL